MGGRGSKRGTPEDTDSHEAVCEFAPLCEGEIPVVSGDLEVEDPSDSSYAELELTLNLAYPELLDRVRRISTTDWHRKHSTEVELAHSAVVAAMQTILKTRSIPDDLVGYLVTIVRNLASRDWGRRETDPIENARPLVIGVFEHGTASSEIEETDGKAIGPSDEHLAGVLLHAGLDEEPSPSGAVSPSAQNLGLTAAVDGLPARQRQVLMLYADRGNSCTQKELAEEIGLSEKNFQMALSRAGKAVCKFLKNMGFSVSETPRWKPVGSVTPKK